MRDRSQLYNGIGLNFIIGKGTNIKGSDTAE